MWLCDWSHSHTGDPIRLRDGIVSRHQLAQSRSQDAQASLDLPWTTSPVEGQINRLKMLKRTMYGRASYSNNSTLAFQSTPSLPIEPGRP